MKPHFTNTNNPIDFPKSENKMNERIKELEKQCWDNQTNHLNAEKFAQLIVRECAETIQDFVDHRFPASEYPVRLKRYFGVE